MAEMGEVVPAEQRSKIVDSQLFVYLQSIAYFLKSLDNNHGRQLPPISIMSVEFEYVNGCQEMPNSMG